MANLNGKEQLNLKKMINESEAEDYTDYIRQVKHSVLIRDDIRKIDTLKNTHSELKLTNHNEFVTLCMNECPFLYNTYADIFNRITKDELDMTIMTKMLVVLKLIEDAKIDQHEGSVMIGRVLKELYVDSAVKRADALDEQYKSEKVEKNEGSSISWKEYKKLK